MIITSSYKQRIKIILKIFFGTSTNSELFDSKEFNEYYFRNSKTITQISIVFGMFIFMIFAIVDQFTLTVSIQKLLYFRLIFFLPLYVLMLFLTFTKYFKKYNNIILFIIFAINANFAVLYVIFIPEKNEIAYKYYQFTEVVLILFVMILSRLRFKRALIVIICNLVLYYSGEFYFKDPFSPEEIGIFLTSSFFIISTLIISIIFNIQLENYIKRDYLTQKELEIEKNKLKLKNDILEDDIALAKKIQFQLIPDPAPTDYIYSLYRPMHEVGGDLYDFVHFRDSKKIGIFISDVSGHGVPAAFITSMIKTTILQSGNRKEDPAELLRYINDVLQNQTAGNFITAFYGVYEPENNSILYASAGHPLPYIISGDGITQLQKGRSTALAIFSNLSMEENNKSYINFKEILPANSKLLLYTDGLTEACSIDKILFENDIMMEVFMENRNFSSRIFIENLYQRLIIFRGEDSFEDDVCLVCLDVI